MKFTETAGGWLISAKSLNIDYKVFMHRNTQTIKSILKENNKITEIYTLILKDNSFSFSIWNQESLKNINTMKKVDPIAEIYMIYGISDLKNKPFPKERTNLKKELFGIELNEPINCNSSLAQALYRNPGIESLEKLLFGKVKNIIKEENLSWNDLEGIYNCPWRNKDKVIQEVGLEYGKYINLFKYPKQFLNTIQEIDKELIDEYWIRKLPQIPQRLKTAEEIEEYIEIKLIQDKRQIPQSFKKINTILGNPIKRKLKVRSDNIQLQTTHIKVNIEYLSPFPLLSIENKTLSNIEIIICEELGMRSKKYIPSRLKRY